MYAAGHQHPLLQQELKFCQSCWCWALEFGAHSLLHIPIGKNHREWYLVGQEMGPAWPIHGFGKCWLRDERLIKLQWGGTASCWKDSSAVLETVDRQSFPAYLGNWWMSQLLRKRKRVRSNDLAKGHTTHNFWDVSNVFHCSMRLFWSPYAYILFTFPEKWNVA